MRAMLAGDARSPDAVPVGKNPTEPSGGLLPTPMFSPVGEFPLDQTHDDTLRCTLDQVIQIDGQLVRP